jgi:hypothetical protein
MRTLGQAFFLESEFGIVHDLPHAGSALEHPLVFDDAAHEIKRFAERGLAEIVSEHHANTVHGTLISALKFKRVYPRELRAEL